jgi:hypothetical protein
VSQVKADLRSPARELPCINCRYFELNCTHPAAGEINVSPVSGKISAVYHDAEKARAEDGACGPEGALFDARSLPGQLAIGFLTSTVGKWTMFFAVAFAADMLLR